MTLAIDEVLAEIDEIHRKKPIFELPLFNRMLDGSFSLVQLREAIKQLGIIPLHNQYYHGPLYVICPDITWRDRIAEVIYEEGTGRLYADGVPHSELYLRLGEGLGIKRDEMLNTRYCAGALGFRAYFSDVCSRTFLEGVSAHMLAGEAAAPPSAGSRAKALKKHYGLSDDEVKFYSVHEVADVDHANIGREFLTDFALTDDDSRLVLKTVEDTLDLMILMHKDIYQYVEAC